MDPTIPVSIMVFFAGLILTIRYALPRWHDVRILVKNVANLGSAADGHAAGLTETKTFARKLAERLDVAEANIKTLNGNLVTVRDQVQFKGIASSLRGQVK